MGRPSRAQRLRLGDDARARDSRHGGRLSGKDERHRRSSVLHGVARDACRTATDRHIADRVSDGGRRRTCGLRCSGLSVGRPHRVDPGVVDPDGVYRNTGPVRIFASEAAAIAALKGLSQNPVKAGDVIWMASYCPQWFVAMGKTPASYIYYKDVNRDPM